MSVTCDLESHWGKQHQSEYRITFYRIYVFSSSICNLNLTKATTAAKLLCAYPVQRRIQLLEVRFKNKLVGHSLASLNIKHLQN